LCDICTINCFLKSVKYEAWSWQPISTYCRRRKCVGWHMYLHSPIRFHCVVQPRVVKTSLCRNSTDHIRQTNDKTEITVY
jgi:hypothetical protein